MAQCSATSSSTIYNCCGRRRTPQNYHSLKHPCNLDTLKTIFAGLPAKTVSPTSAAVGGSTSKQVRCLGSRAALTPPESRSTIPSPMLGKWLPNVTMEVLMGRKRRPDVRADWHKSDGGCWSLSLGERG